MNNDLDVESYAQLVGFRIRYPIFTDSLTAVHSLFFFSYKLNSDYFAIFVKRIEIFGISIHFADNYHIQIVYLVIVWHEKGKSLTHRKRLFEYITIADHSIYAKFSLLELFIIFLFKTKEFYSLMCDNNNITINSRFLYSFFCRILIISILMSLKNLSHSQSATFFSRGKPLLSLIYFYSTMKWKNCSNRSILVKKVSNAAWILPNYCWLLIEFLHKRKSRHTDNAKRNGRGQS